MMGRGKWGRDRASCKTLLIAFAAVNVLIPPASALGYSTGDGTEFTCGYADYAVHTHNEFCYDEEIASTSNAKIMIQAEAMIATPGSATITE